MNTDPVVDPWEPASRSAEAIAAAGISAVITLFHKLHGYITFFFIFALMPIFLTTVSIEEQCPYNTNFAMFLTKNVLSKEPVLVFFSPKFS